MNKYIARTLLILIAIIFWAALVSFATYFIRIGSGFYHTWWIVALKWFFGVPITLILLSLIALGISKLIDKSEWK